MCPLPWLVVTEALSSAGGKLMAFCPAGYCIIGLTILVASGDQFTKLKLSMIDFTEVCFTKFENPSLWVSQAYSLFSEKISLSISKNQWRARFSENDQTVHNDVWTNFRHAIESQIWFCHASIVCLMFKEKCIVCHKYSRYHNKTKTVVFTIKDDVLGLQFSIDIYLETNLKHSNSTIMWSRSLAERSKCREKSFNFVSK